MPLGAQVETKSVTASSIVGVRRNADGAKVLLIQTTYGDASVEEHVVPVLNSRTV